MICLSAIMSKETSIKPHLLSRDSETTLSGGSVQSCFRNRNENVKNCINRRVSFPEDEKEIVTGYLEPANPWEYAEDVNKEDVISNYIKSCEKHGARPINSILDQIQDLDFNLERNECLDLKGRTLTSLDCETLEEILKRVQFVSINLEQTSIDDESSVALFDMVEYYEAAVHLNISGNHSIGVQGWQACSRMIKRTKCLEELEARNTTLNEQYMPILSRALRLSSQLVILKLENCSLSGRPIVILAAALRLNTGLKELFLGENYLGVNDASQLGAMLKCNCTLQLLDLSNNSVYDGGMKHITDGLLEQTSLSETGLGVLIMWNNHLTLNSSQHIARLLANSKTLETLNVGQNILSNEVLFSTKHALQQNRTLLRLGMQSTHLTCEGAIALAEIIADNSTIERIDLRDNNLQVAGLMALVHSMKVNTSVTQLDLDDSPRRKYSGNALEEYARLVKEIRGYCQRNEDSRSPDTTSEDLSESGVDDSADDSLSSKQNSFAFRKISLTCETLMKTTNLPPVDTSGTSYLTEPRRSGGRLRSPAPSPIPSPVASPSPTRSRFQVSRVSESDSPTTPPSASPSPPTIFFGSGSSSRFKVTVIDSAPVSNTMTAPTVVPSNNVTKGFDTAVSKPLQPSTNTIVTPTPVPATSTTFERSSVSPPSETIIRPAPLKSRSDTEDSDRVDSPKSKLPKAMDSIDLSALRITKQVSVMEKPPSARTRKISWVQPASMFTATLSSSQSSQDDTASAALPSSKPSGLEKLLGLFSNPFSRSKTEEEQQQTNQAALSSVPEQTSEKQQPNCDNKSADKDTVKKTAGEFLEQTLNMFYDSKPSASVLSRVSGGGSGSGIGNYSDPSSLNNVTSCSNVCEGSERKEVIERIERADTIIEETDLELDEAADTLAASCEIVTKDLDKDVEGAEEEAEENKTTVNNEISVNTCDNTLPDTLVERVDSVSCKYTEEGVSCSKGVNLKVDVSSESKSCSSYDEDTSPDVLNNNNNNNNNNIENGVIAGNDEERRRRRSEEERRISETWPQGRGCVGRINPFSLDAQSKSAPCLTALVLLQGNVSSELAAELKKISPTESAESMESGQPPQPTPPQQQQPQNIGVAL